MTTLLQTESGAETTPALDGLAAEVRAYSESLAVNMMQLGRAFTEAKKLVRHGEWQKWVRANAGMSDRSAQQFMAVYARFGTENAFTGIEKSKLFKMLSLPDGTESAFMAENDVGEMTTREVEEAVKKTRATEGNSEQPAKPEIEDAEIPEEVRDALIQKDNELAQTQKELRRVGDLARELMEENKKIKRESEETREMLEETQDAHREIQDELLTLKSTTIRQEAEGEHSTGLTAEAFADAVCLFIGTVAQMPHMARMFAETGREEHERYDAALRTVEGWASGARKALDTIIE